MVCQSMSRIKYSQAAARKLDSIHHYISETLRSPRAATRVVKSIIERINTLKESPFIGPRLSSRIDGVPERFSETRYLVCDRHIVIYEPGKTGVSILAIYHSTEDTFGRVLSELDE